MGNDFGEQNDVTNTCAPRRLDRRSREATRRKLEYSAQHSGAGATTRGEPIQQLMARTPDYISQLNPHPAGIVPERQRDSTYGRLLPRRCQIYFPGHYLGED